MGYWYYRPSRPREARGGIKAQSKRGRFGESWWARRWIEVLEGFHIGARLSRGRSYARRGQVLDVDIRRGKVSARVQGSRPEPYRVEIKVKTLSRAKWKRLAEALSRQAVFAAKLLAGRMPENIEDAFRGAGLSLFPDTGRDLRTDCSCPDWSNPCKHIAAVYYLLGEEFDRDPFLIFKLRGMSREELVSLVGGHGASKSEARPPRGVTAQGGETDDERRYPPQPLSSDPDAFWGQRGTEAESRLEASIPTVPAALPKRLGSFPFWRGEESFLSTMEEIYEDASPLGLEVFLARDTRQAVAGDGADRG
ncbi:MAG: SWIM zinc finger family protein [Acidobacteriota bacterium]